MHELGELPRGGALRGRRSVLQATLKRVLLAWLLLLPAATLVADEAFLHTPQGARYRDLAPGAGPAAAPGDVATIHFVGWLDAGGQRGREFYNSRREPRPVSFVIGTAGVMPGWNDGVIGMRAGGKRLLMLPPALGYGSRGVEGVVPSNAALIFVIELLELEQRPPH